MNMLEKNSTSTVNPEFWRNKRVFLTGHTGFKGSWLSLLLHNMGAHITGYSLTPPTNPSLFDLARIKELLEDIRGDVRDLSNIIKCINNTKPEIIIHLAAQALVCESYKNPIDTYAINVMGTANLLEAVRQTEGVRVVVNVTTDKCYENREWVWGYREHEAMGGHDPYSSSKGCSELVTSAYRRSFFNPQEYTKHGVALASARAGNVIGGGDWANDRLIPDCVRALLKGEPVQIRNPHAVRPWQHVLEPLSGYLLLAESLYRDGPMFAEAWNFGPDDADARSVGWIVKALCARWQEGASFEIDKVNHPHEASYLKLDCSKARTRLNWRPVWGLSTALDKIVEWTKAYRDSEDIRKICLAHIKEYES
jgi:CDP-glucose 4,6-dehydratase